MTKTITILISVAVSLATLYFLLGSVILSIAIGVILICIPIFSTFALASWWSAKLMQSGAQIALQSQNSDNKQVQAIGSLTKDVLKFSQSQQPTQPLQLPDNGIDAEFDIYGLEN